MTHIARDIYQKPGVLLHTKTRGWVRVFAPILQESKNEGVYIVMPTHELRFYDMREGSLQQSGESTNRSTNPED